MCFIFVGEKTLVQMCAERGLDSYLRILLRQGADANSCTVRRRSSGLLLAAEAGHAHVIQVGIVKTSISKRRNLFPFLILWYQYQVHCTCSRILDLTDSSSKH
jgi:hypothetical protein